MDKRTRLPAGDGEPFIAALEEHGVEAGDPDYVAANVPKLRRLIGDLQDRIYELSQLQYRARVVLDRHEPDCSTRRKQKEA
ncbi:MAG: hypothetical protein NT031_18815 [Planctomycetota bacterium]|nr:hypothetical protein [Planctomycetota bacterium]